MRKNERAGFIIALSSFLSSLSQVECLRSQKHIMKRLVEEQKMSRKKVADPKTLQISIIYLIARLFCLEKLAIISIDDLQV